VVVHALVDVDLDNTSLDALAEDLLVERIRTVENETHTVTDGFVDRLEAVVFEPDATGAIRAMHVAESRGEELDSSGHEFLGLLWGGENTFEIGCLRDTIFSALNAPRLGFSTDIPLVKVLHQLLGECEILLLLVMAHIAHDAIETVGNGSRALDQLRSLAMIEVEGNRNGGRVAGLGGSDDEGVAGVLDGPWEQLDDGWRLGGFGGTNSGDHRLNVVAAHGWDSIVAIASCIDDLENAVLGERWTRHDGGVYK
jgi:hypothetical protein